jgi:type III pantothenate kinase
MNPAVVVDVGNSCIKWGRCAGDRVAEMVSLPHDDEAVWRWQLEAWKITANTRWVVSGVRPRQRERLQDWLVCQHQQVALIDSCQRIPLVVHVDSPENVGLDRLFNAVALNSVRPPNAAGIVVDAGTAVTVDYLDAAGAFCGGAIMPGLRLMAESLHRHTALLPLIDGFDAAAMPAKNTEDAMRMGIESAAVGGIDRLIHQLDAPNASLFVTGGDAGFFAARSSLAGRLQVWPEMTLEGIRASVGAA